MRKDRILTMFRKALDTGPPRVHSPETMSIRRAYIEAAERMKAGTSLQDALDRVCSEYGLAGCGRTKVREGLERDHQAVTMARPQAQAFVAALIELARRHDIKTIQSCGCCNGISMDFTNGSQADRLDVNAEDGKAFFYVNEERIEVGG